MDGHDHSMLVRTPDQRLRVFVSSTLGELAEERQAVRAAIEQLGFAPVMFELGARPHPPRTLYRSYLEQSDVFIGIYWERYGWVAPDMDISGLEDEYVLSGGLPRLVYVKRPAPAMDDRLGDLLARLQAEDTTSYKPFRDAVELQQLVVDDLAVMLTERFDAARPPASSPRSFGNLPAPTTALVGREAVLSQLDDLLDAGVRLLTLIGAGGTGKTRVSLQLAADRSATYADGAVFVDLSAARDADSAFAAIARTLALESAADGSPLDVIHGALRDKELLLLLDNCEHATDAGRGLSDLLSRSPRLTILATSQVALNVRGEQLFPVPPLSLPAAGTGRVSVPAALASEAVRLFVERARAVEPEFTLTEHDVSDVVAVCTCLDGLPLAIELAAARVNLFSVDELRARLAEQLDLLESRVHGTPERQRTLRGAIAWSNELLTASERRTLALFSVFEGARLADLVETVHRIPAFADVDVVGDLGSLVDKSLVRSIPGSDRRPRFSMLRTVREYASEQLEADAAEADVARLAHAESYTHLAGELWSGSGADDRDVLMSRLGDDLDNLRAAWAHWVRHGEVARLGELVQPLWGYFDARGDYRATAELGTDVLDVLHTQPETPERMRDESDIRISIARSLVVSRGFTSGAEASMRAALEQPDAAGGGRQRFPALRCLASLQMLRGDFAASVVVADELLAVAERERDPSLLSEAHLLTGATRIRLKGLDESLEHVCRAVDYEDGSTSGFAQLRVGPHPKVVSNTVKGLLLWMTGTPERAVSQIARAFTIAAELDHPYSTCYALFHGGLLDLWRRDLDALAIRADQLVETAEVHEYPIWRALGDVLRGTAGVGLGDIDGGLATVDRGFALYEGLATPPVFWPALLMIRARACAMAGRLDDALSLIDQAEAAAADDDPLASDISIVKGDLLLARTPGNPDAAGALFEHAASLAARRDARLVQLQALTRLTNLRRGTPRGREVLDRLREVLDAFTEGFSTPDLVEARLAVER